MGVKKSMKLLKELSSHRCLGTKFYSFQDVMHAENLHGVNETLIRLMEEKSIKHF